MELYLLAAIRGSGRHQYQVANRAGLRETRLSNILRRGGATAQERAALSAALGVDEHRLFPPDDAESQDRIAAQCGAISADGRPNTSPVQTGSRYALTASDAET